MKRDVAERLLNDAAALFGRMEATAQERDFHTALRLALQPELSTVVTPLADLQAVRAALMAEMERSDGEQLLKVVAQLRQVLGQINRMENAGGAKGVGSGGGAGKLANMKQGRGGGG